MHPGGTEIHFASKQQWWDWHWSFSVRGLLEQLEPEAVDAYRDGCFREMDALETDGGYPLRLIRAHRDRAEVSSHDGR